MTHYADLLLNIARAHGHLQRDEEAIRFLERYLVEKPDADDAPSVNAEITARRQALAARAEAARVKAEAERIKAEAAERAKPGPPPRPKWPGIVLLGGGAALVVG